MGYSGENAGGAGSTWEQGRGGSAGAKLLAGWEGFCDCIYADAGEGGVREGVETGVSSWPFAHSEIWAPGEAGGLVKNDGG